MGVTEMTLTGKVFKAYAGEIVTRHGYGSKKMVEHGSPKFIATEIMKGQDLVNKANWAMERVEMDAAEFDLAIKGGEIGHKIWEDLAASEKWLIDNGYLRAYTTYTPGIHYSGKYSGRIKEHVGLTPKGWKVAKKYIESEG